MYYYCYYHIPVKFIKAILTERDIERIAHQRIIKMIMQMFYWQQVSRRLCYFLWFLNDKQ